MNQDSHRTWGKSSRLKSFPDKQGPVVQNLTKLLANVMLKFLSWNMAEASIENPQIKFLLRIQKKQQYSEWKQKYFQRKLLKFLFYAL